MVLKKGKYGVSTGNTLKSCNKLHMNRYRSYSFITRTFTGDRDKFYVSYEDELGWANQSDESLEYSLSKKGRWLLPELIQECALDTSTYDDIDIQLKESHRLSSRYGKANCVGFVSSVAETPDEDSARKIKSKWKGRGYFHDSSIINEPAEKENKTNKKNKRNVVNDLQGKNDEHLQSHLQYNVEYPCPADSYTSHCHKYIEYFTNYERQLQRDSCRPPARRLRTKMRNVIQESIDCMYDELDDMSDDDGVGLAAVSTKEMRTNFNDMLQNAKRTSTKKSKRMKNKHSLRKETAQDDEPTHQEEEEAVDEVSTQELASSVNASSTTSYEPVPRYPILEPVMVILPVRETNANRLQKAFGAKYIECLCSPRKFILEISEDVARVNKTLNTDARVNLAFACLTFVHDAENELNNEKENVFKVSLNADLSESIDRVRITTLFEYAKRTIENIVEQTIFFVSTLPNERTVNKKQYTQGYQSSSKTALEVCAKWQNRSYRPDLKQLFEKSFCRSRSPGKVGKDSIKEHPQNTLEATVSVVRKLPVNEVCFICYEDVGGTVSGTALVSCGHWFCDSCWGEHLLTSMRQGRTEFICPDYDCDSLVDSGTLLSMLQMNQVMIYLRRRHDSDVDRQLLTKWCQSPTCGRVLRVQSREVMAMSCQCGLKICFMCLNEVHWPAKCDVAAAYRQKLVDNREDNIVPVEVTQTVTVHGKHCPFCRRFVEKDGGCPYMLCICGKGFCWGCGKGWSMSNHDEKCYIGGTLDNHNTVNAFVYSEDNVQLQTERMSKLYKAANWYKIAVEHRSHRHQNKYRKLFEESVPQLVNALKNYVRRSRKTFDFEIPDKYYKSEGSKAEDFVRNTVDLCAELRQINEYVAVFLDNTSVNKESLELLEGLISRLSELSGNMYNVLLNGAHDGGERVFGKLKESRAHSMNCITELLNFINQLDVPCS